VRSRGNHEVVPVIVRNPEVDQRNVGNREVGHVIVERGDRELDPGTEDRDPEVDRKISVVHGADLETGGGDLVIVETDPEADHVIGDGVGVEIVNAEVVVIVALEGELGAGHEIVDVAGADLVNQRQLGVSALSLSPLL